MTVEISITDRQRILDHAASSSDEVCGLLLGDHGGITAVRPCANVSACPARRFELDPAALIGALRAARGGGPGLIGHYHSHPSGSYVPSSTDAAEAVPDGAIWIIAASGELAAWRAVAGGSLHGRFDRVVLHVTSG